MFNEEQWGISLGQQICDYTRVFERFLTTPGEIKEKIINSSFKTKEEIERHINNKSHLSIYKILKGLGIEPICNLTDLKL